MKGLEGSECLRIGAVVKADFGFTNASSADRLQVSFFGHFFRISVRGVVMELNL